MPGINASLYIHIPFCACFCDYCDFFSIKIKDVSDDYIDSFLQALISDIKYQLDFFSVKEIPSVYIGGGTPSVLGKKIKILFDALSPLIKIMQSVSSFEFTVEANPESLSEEFLSICNESGVNRLSLGVQTFQEKSRAAVNRAGDSLLLEKKLSFVSRSFQGVFCADLMTGLPYQSEETVINDINRILAFNPCHISLYSLTLEDNTPLKEKIKNKTVIVPDCEYADSLWLKGRDLLLKEGFDHYEVSNFARNNKKCVHNIRYWNMRSWLGAGLASSGTIVNENNNSAMRFTCTKDIDFYINAIKEEKKPLSAYDSEELVCAAFLKENILMGYRCKEGVDQRFFKERFNFFVEHYIGKTLEKWKGKDRMLFLNSFLYDAFNELESMI